MGRIIYHPATKNDPGAILGAGLGMSESGNNPVTTMRTPVEA
jgi:hypothetical protein